MALLDILRRAAKGGATIAVEEAQEALVELEQIGHRASGTMLARVDGVAGRFTDEARGTYQELNNVTGADILDDMMAMFRERDGEFIHPDDAEYEDDGEAPAPMAAAPDEVDGDVDHETDDDEGEDEPPGDEEKAEDYELQEEANEGAGVTNATDAAGDDAEKAS